MALLPPVLLQQTRSVTLARSQTMAAAVQRRMGEVAIQRNLSPTGQ